MHMVYTSPVCKCVVEGAEVEGQEGHVEELLSRLLLVHIMHKNC